MWGKWKKNRKQENISVQEEKIDWEAESQVGEVRGNRMGTRNGNEIGKRKTVM